MPVAGFVSPYARALALLLRLVALGMIALAGLRLFLEYVSRRLGRGDGDPYHWLASGLVLVLGLVLLWRSGRWARRWMKHWDE